MVGGKLRMWKPQSHLVFERINAQLSPIKGPTMNIMGWQSLKENIHENIDLIVLDANIHMPN